MNQASDFSSKNVDPFYKLLEHAQPRLKTLYTLHQKISEKPNEQAIMQQYACNTFPLAVGKLPDQMMTSQVEHLQLIDRLYQLINKTSDQAIDQNDYPEIQDDLYRILILPDSEQKEAWQTYLEVNLNLQDNSVQQDRQLQECLDPIILEHSGTPFREALLAIGQSREASAKLKRQALAEAKKLASTCAQNFLTQFSGSKLGDYDNANKDNPPDFDSPFDAMLSFKYFSPQNMQTHMKDLLEGQIKEYNIDPSLYAQEVIKQVESVYSEMPKYNEVVARQERKIQITKNEALKEKLVVRHNQLVAPQQLINAAKAIMQQCNEDVQSQPRSSR